MPRGNLNDSDGTITRRSNHLIWGIRGFRVVKFPLGTRDRDPGQFRDHEVPEVGEIADRSQATLIGRRFHVSYSVSGATRLMRRLGFTPQVPTRRAAERDEQVVAAWREVTWAEVKEPGRTATERRGVDTGSVQRADRVQELHPRTVP
ncbi:winged helix-turn-helix domain-containing protein [Kitasatospora sp. NPDC004669]|uniref:helix-turn-helix domain-containing protein n=1 Tax=Kitasatospora sp. NPDC004669 TaxID=3154555 RepID=UPI0033B91B9D